MAPALMALPSTMVATGRREFWICEIMSRREYTSPPKLSNTIGMTVWPVSWALAISVANFSAISSLKCLLRRMTTGSSSRSALFARILGSTIMYLCILSLSVFQKAPACQGQQVEHTLIIVELRPAAKSSLYIFDLVNQAVQGAEVINFIFLPWTAQEYAPPCVPAVEHGPPYISVCCDFSRTSPAWPTHSTLSSWMTVTLALGTERFSKCRLSPVAM